MTMKDSNADTIIAEIDAGELRPTLLSVVRELHRNMGAIPSAHFAYFFRYPRHALLDARRVLTAARCR